MWGIQKVTVWQLAVTSHRLKSPWTNQQGEFLLCTSGIEIKGTKCLMWWIFNLCHNLQTSFSLYSNTQINWISVLLLKDWNILNYQNDPWQFQEIAYIFQVISNPSWFFKIIYCIDCFQVATNQPDNRGFKVISKLLAVLDTQQHALVDLCFLWLSSALSKD